MGYSDTAKAQIGQGADPLDRPITVTRFKSVKDNGAERKHGTLRKLARDIGRKTAPRKEDLPLIKLAEFGATPSEKGHLRHDGNVTGITGIELDYDKGERTPEDAVQRLRSEGVAGVIVTTPNHGQPGKGNRWRPYLPLSRTYRPEERERLARKAAAILGGGFASESFALSTAFYAGGLNERPPQVFLSEGGVFLDEVDDVKEAPPPDDRDHSGSGVAFRFLAALAHRGAPEGEAIEAIAADVGPAGEWWGRTDQRQRGRAVLHAYKQAATARDSIMADLDADDDADRIEDDELAEIDALVGRPGDTAPARLRGFQLLSPADCAANDPTPYVLKGLIAAGDVVSVVGAPGVGKSVFAPHIAYAVAQGRSVFGRRVRQGPVLYVAAENDRDMQKRVRALRDKFDDAPDLRLVLGGGGRLRDGKTFRRELMAAIKELRPVLIVVDTLAAAMGAFEENSSEGMGEAIATAQSLGSHGAAVMIVHHDTKSGDGLPRGHGTLHGIVDMNLALKRTGKTVTGTPSKNRNGDSHVPVLAYAIKTVELGTDSDGDPITTVICDQEDASPKAERGPKLNDRQTSVFDIFCELAGHGDVDPAEWREKAMVAISANASDKSRSDMFYKSRRELTALGLIEELDGLWTLVDQAHDYDTGFPDDDD